MLLQTVTETLSIAKWAQPKRKFPVSLLLKRRELMVIIISIWVNLPASATWFKPNPSLQTSRHLTLTRWLILWLSNSFLWYKQTDYMNKWMNADNYIVHKQGLRKTRLSHSPFQVFAGLVVSRETGFFCREKPNISHCTIQKRKLT